jgi:DNA topoisomerase-1
LICDREQEIREFQSKEYWTITASLKSGRNPLEARLMYRAKEKLELENELSVNEIMLDLQGAPYLVAKISSRQRKRNAQPPFITSTLQQEAGKVLNFPVRKTMQIAQQLYEGLDMGKDGAVGLITYMRTDSPQISASAQQSARTFIDGAYGQDYVPETPPVYKSKGRAQEAHEAIRPTETERAPDKVKPFLSRDQHRLYKLIWERFIASQMSPAIMDATTVDIQAGDYLFRSSGSVVRFPGFLVVYKETEAAEPVLPELHEGEALTLVKLNPEQHFTQPPPRYTEAALVKMLEEKGIGRPSTYATIIETIQTRGYVIRQEKNLAPTELGFIVGDLLKEYFPQIVDVEFTASMEERLDEVEDGGTAWQKIVEEFYQPFEENLEHAEQVIENISLAEEQSEELCPKCGRHLNIKQGRYGKFLACPGFPECRHTQRYYEKTGISCPRCGGIVVERRSQRGRRFYGCSNYPECSFSTWDEPSSLSCPDCGNFLVYTRRGKQLLCPTCDKRWEESELKGPEK